MSAGPNRDGERLAAYLVGELDADERRELEARLGREPALRARLDAIRRADEALGDLPEVAPRPAFSERLREELRAELRSHGAPATGGDELAARRRVRERGAGRSWVTQLGAAAAVLLLFTVAGVGLTQLIGGGDDDQPTADEGGVALESIETDGADVAASAAPGPVVVALGRSYTKEDVTVVADHPAFLPVLGLGGSEAETTSRSFSAALGVERAAEDDGETGAPAAPEGGGAEELDAPPADVQVTGSPSDDQLADVQRCLPQLLEEAGTVVPVYAELASFEGEEAIVYGLAAEPSGSDDLTRVEVWVVGRDDCQVRYYTQVDR